MGGSDQWGNITAGIELIRKVRGKKAHGLVWPLMKTAAGTKFGKTEAGTVWLDPARTSERDFYQFWLQTDDRDVINYLKVFTWLDRAEIDALETRGAGRSGRRARRSGASRDEVTRAVHGESALAQVQSDAALRFGGALTAESLQSVAPSPSVSASKITAGPGEHRAGGDCGPGEVEERSVSLDRAGRHHDQRRGGERSARRS